MTRFWTVFVAAIVVLTAIRIAVVLTAGPDAFFGKYIIFADELREGTLATDRIPDLSPGYLRFIAALRAAGFGVDAIRALQIALLSVAALLAATIAHRYGGRVAAVAAAALMLANKAALVNATDIEPETILLVFSTAGLALLIWNGRPWTAACAGLAFGVAATMRPVALLPALLAGLWLARRHLRAAVVFAVGAALPVGAIIAANFVLTGSFLLMDPGTVFYEGMNPNATGYAGVAPRIVKDIEPGVGGPDTMHVAYRIVASCALERKATREEANRYWSGKAWAFVEAYPVRAVALSLRKLRLLVSAYDAYDVPSMVLQDRALRAPLWISWAILTPLAIAGAAFARREATPVFIYVIAAGVSPIAFFVTARHRNPLLPGLAVLGGVAVAGLLRMDRRRAVALLLLIAAAAAALSIEGDLQREDRFLWTAFFETSRFMQDAPSNATAAAAAVTRLPESVPPAAPQLVRTIAMRELARTSSPARLFSLAVALLDAGDAATADEVLRRLQEIDYQPFRRTRGVSSVAFYRARALMQLGRRDEARQQLARAGSEAAGDANVLALIAVANGDRAAAARLDKLHDPFTRDYTLARAFVFTGRSDDAKAVAARAAAGCPAWSRPRRLLN